MPPQEWGALVIGVEQIWHGVEHFCEVFFTDYAWEVGFPRKKKRKKKKKNTEENNRFLAADAARPLITMLKWDVIIGLGNKTIMICITNWHLIKISNILP